MTTALTVIQMLGVLIPLVMELMKTVEAEMGSGTGVDKKAAVLTGIQAVISDADIWNKTSGIFSTLIDFMAKLHFNTKG